MSRFVLLNRLIVNIFVLQIVPANIDQFFLLGLTTPQPSTQQIVRRATNSTPTTVKHVRVNHSRRYIFVTQQLLNRSDVIPVVNRRNSFKTFQPFKWFKSFNRTNSRSAFNPKLYWNYLNPTRASDPMFFHSARARWISFSFCLTACRKTEHLCRYRERIVV